MKFKSLPLLVAALMPFLFSVRPALGQETSVFIEGGGASFIGLDNEFGGTAAIGLELPYLGFRVTGTFFSDEREYFPLVEHEDVAAGLYGDADLYRLSADLYAKFDWDYATLYIGAGFSWFSLDGTVDFQLKRWGYRFKGSLDIDGDTDLCFNTFAGIRVFLFDPLYLFAEVRYDMETNLKLEVDDVIIAKFEDLGGVSIVGGIGLRF